MRVPRPVRVRWGRGVGGAGRGALVGVILAVVVVANACGLPDSRGVELGHLRGLAERVEGGGVECPLAIPRADIRPPGVAADAAIVPARENGPGSDAKIGGETLPTADSVWIMCRWLVEDREVTLVVVGVNEGHAAASLAPDLDARGDAADTLTFLTVNAELPVGRAAPLTGDPPGVFTRVQASHGDVALVLTVDAAGDDVTLPRPGELEPDALAIADTLAN